MQAALKQLRAQAQHLLAVRSLGVFGAAAPEIMNRL
jgi:hypothetical protein